MSLEEDDTHSPECPELKEFIDKKFKQLKELLLVRNVMIMKAFGMPEDHGSDPINTNYQNSSNNNTFSDDLKTQVIGQNLMNDNNYETTDKTIEGSIKEVFWEDIIRKAAPGETVASIISSLPCISGEDLANWDKRICKENEDVFIIALKSVIRNDLNKNFHLILCNELILEFNLDGKCGKARFKDFKNFYNVLRKAIIRDNYRQDPDNCIREAFQYTKKLHYTKISTQKRKSIKDPLEGL